MSHEIARRQLGTGGPEITAVGFGAWAAGGGGLVLRLGAAGRRGVHCRHAPGRRSRRQLDRHRGRLRARALRGGRRPLSQDAARVRSAARVHQVRTRSGTTPTAWQSPARNPAARRRSASECDASLRRLGVERIDLFQFHWPDETGVAGRRLVGGDGAARRGGQGPLRRRLELRRPAARALRGGRVTSTRCSRRSR